MMLSACKEAKNIVISTCSLRIILPSPVLHALLELAEGSRAVEPGRRDRPMLLTKGFWRLAAVTPLQDGVWKS